MDNNELVILSMDNENLMIGFHQPKLFTKNISDSPINIKLIVVKIKYE